MTESLENMLSGRFRKSTLLDFLKENPKLFDETVRISLGNVQPQSWRAAWLIANYIQENDSRLITHLDSILSKISEKGDGHQRELLKIIRKMELSEEQEGVLFDKVISIWEEVDRSPSVRGTAFITLLSIVRKYPELKSEISYLTQPHYTATLSPGIKRSFHRILRDEGMQQF